MKKHSLVPFFGILIVAAALLPGQVVRKTRAAAPASNVWANQFVPTDFSVGTVKVFSAPDGGVFLLLQNDHIGVWDVEEEYPVVVRLNGRGRVLWQTAFPSFGPPADLAVASDGGCWVADFYGGLIKLTSAGTLSWSRKYQIQGASSTWMSSFYLTPAESGELFVAGSIYSNNTNLPFVMRLNAAGDVVWGAMFSRPEALSLAGLAGTPSGGLVIGGKIGDPDQGWWAIALDGQGGIRWQKKYGLGINSFVTRIFPREDGGSILAGCVDHGSPYSAACLRLDADGGVVWGRSFDGEEIQCRKSSGDGGDWIMSKTAGLMKLDSDGRLAAAYPVSFSVRYVLTAAAAPDGGFVLGGMDQYGSPDGPGLAVVAKTDVRGFISDCAPTWGPGTASLSETWTPSIASFSVAALSVDISANPVSSSAVAGTWNVVCRNPNYVYLTVSKSAGGWTNPPAGQSEFERGAQAAIEAFPAVYYDFLQWTGDVPEQSRRNASILLSMSADKAVHPEFIKIQAPLNISGRRVRPGFRPPWDILTWAPNPENRDVVKYRVFSRAGQTETLLGEVQASFCRFVRRGATGSADTEYAVCAVTASGREGVRATLSLR